MQNASSLNIEEKGYDNDVDGATTTIIGPTIFVNDLFMFIHITLFVYSS